MTAIIYLFAMFATLQASHSYILLTANLEDVQALATQIKESPVVGQINKIWRRAANTFNQHARRYGDDDPSSDLAAEEPYRRSGGSGDKDDDMVALGRHASKYLKTINKLFETQ